MSYVIDRDALHGLGVIRVFRGVLEHACERLRNEEEEEWADWAALGYSALEREGGAELSVYIYLSLWWVVVGVHEPYVFAKILIESYRWYGCVHEIP